MRYLVTGATGFVGSHVVDHLLERGESVRALVRTSAPVGSLRARGVELWPGNLMDGTDMTRAVDGMDVVIHCAGIVPDRFSSSPESLWPVNVGGTERLLMASAKVGVGRFVHLSSVTIYGAAPPPITEDTPKRPVGTYSESKWAAERALWRSHAEHGVPAVALRTCVIYGPRDRKFTPGLLRRCRTRVAALPDGGRRLLDLVFVSDVVTAVLAAATTPAAVGHAYNVTDGEFHTLRDIGNAYGSLTGRRPAILPIPGRALVNTLRLAARLIRIGRLPAACLELAARLEIFRHDIHYAIDAARRDLGYAPRVGLTEGLRRSLAGVT